MQQFVDFSKNRMRSLRLVFWLHCLLCITVGTVQAQVSDLRILEEINLNRNKNLDGWMNGLSHSAYPFTMGIPLAQTVYGLASKDSAHFSRGVSMLAAGTVNFVFTKSLKHSVGRERPFIRYPHLQNLQAPRDPSWPSGHTSGAFALATSVSMAYPKWYVVAPAALWACGVGYSRLHLGVHYPSDVWAGALLGTASALASHYLNRWVQGKYAYTKKLRLESEAQ